MADWRTIDTAPKEGRPIRLTWFENGEPAEIYVMQWGHIQRNVMFPEKVGMWVSPCGSFTWNDDGMGGGPEYWAPVEEEE